MLTSDELADLNNQEANTLYDMGLITGSQRSEVGGNA